LNDEQVELALGFHLGTPHRKPFQLPKRLICISLQRTCRRLRVGSLQIAEVTLCTRPKMSGVTTICASGAARSSVNTTDVYRPPESILTAYEFDGSGSEYSIPERLLLSTYHDLTSASPLLAREPSRQAAAVRRRIFVGLVIPKGDTNPWRKVWEKLIKQGETQK
jgi:hypothetical protein